MCTTYPPRKKESTGAREKRERTRSLAKCAPNNTSMSKPALSFRANFKSRARVNWHLPLRSFSSRRDFFASIQLTLARRAPPRVEASSPRIFGEPADSGALGFVIITTPSVDLVKRDEIPYRSEEICVSGNARASARARVYTRRRLHRHHHRHHHRRRRRRRHPPRGWLEERKRERCNFSYGE